MLTEPHRQAIEARAKADPAVAANLHAISRMRGRADALEHAIAAGDLRARLRALLELGELIAELKEQAAPANP